MLNDCVYYIKGNPKPYSYDSLWSALNQTQLDELNKVSDILFSKYPKQEAQKNRLETLKQKVKETKQQQNFLFAGDVAEDGENGEKAISTFLTSSPEATINGNSIVRQFVVEDFKQNEIRTRTELGMSEQEATKEVEKEISSWETIAEDSKLIHKLLTDPIIAVPEDKKAEFIQRAKSIVPKDSKLYDDTLLGTLYDQLKTFYLDSKGHYVDSEVLRNINLTAQLRNSNTKLLGHIDYAFVDTSGTLHIYNFKVTHNSLNKWSRDKINTFRYEQAFLKQILANNGINIKNIDMRIVPLQVKYNGDYNQIQEMVIRESKNYDIDSNSKYVGQKFDNTAKYFIEESNQIENITEEHIKTADQINKAIFPFINVKSDVIGKSVIEWINSAKTVGDSEPLIIRQLETGEWEVFINGTKHLITNPIDKSRNKDIIELVTKHLDKLNTNGTYINNIKEYLIDSHRRGFVNIEKLKRNSDFFNKEFAQYVHKSEIGEKKISDWKLLDDLADCNILMFKNRKTGIIDVITLSQSNLDVIPNYPKKGNSNVLAAYRRDSQIDMPLGDLGQIENIRTLVLLNQIIDKIPNAKLGQLKVISQFGQRRIYHPENDAQKYLKEIFKVIKKEVRDLPEFNYNFKSNHFSDPVENLIREYHAILADLPGGKSKFLSETMRFEELEDAKDKEQKRVALFDIAKSIQGVLSRKANIEEIANDNRQDSQTRNLAKLYLLVSQAYLNYSGENLEYNKPMSELRSFVTTAPTVSSSNVRIVVNNLQTTLDSIAENIEAEYTKNMRKFLMDFYKESGYTSLENITIGDQNRLFKNMYQKDSSGKRKMLFKNPYDNSNDLAPAERKFLKKALFEFNRIRQIRRNDIKKFTSYEDPAISEYISNNSQGEKYLWVPLKRASKTSQRQNVGALINDYKRKFKQLFKLNGSQAFDEFVNNLSPEERQILDQDINELSIHNPMLEWENDSLVRQDRINKLGVDYFETNVEDLLLNFLARSVEVEKFQNFLTGTKMLLLQLDMMGDTDANKKEAKYIEEYLKVNVFKKSVMEPTSQEIVSRLTPVRTFVTYANLAGNAVAYFRDIENGFMENYLRTVTKFQTDISAANLTKAYGYVITHGSSNTMNINMLSKLCVKYRLSNTDLARITERLKTNRGGIYNWDNWAFSTLRSPDFLNRMTLFVAKAMQDGCFDAWYIENDELKYNWKKDKRFSIYASGDKTNPEYAKQKGLYIMKIQEWNQEHPQGIKDENGHKRALNYNDDLPTPYSQQDILAIRNVGDNIYGSYDRSLRAMGENKALGWAFGMYTTWMNGMWNNWTLKPGKYNINQMNTIIETNENGEEIWMDKHGNFITQKIDSNGVKYYIDEETGERKEADCPVMKKVPVIVQGILYTFKDMIGILQEDGIKETIKYLKSDPVAQKNMRQAISQILIVLLHLMLIKLALEEAYKDHKKHSSEYNVANNIMAEVGYKSFRQAGDTFRGPLNIIDYVGDSNPPIYKVPTKLIGDAAKFVMGDKSFQSVITGNFAIMRSFRDTAKLYENSK